MKTLLKIISYVGLAFTIIPAVLVFHGIIDMQAHFTGMVIGVILWFATAPFWMKSKSLEE